MVGKSDTDAPTFAAPGPLTKTVELPITADDYFKMASASVSDSNATDVDKKPAIKRSRVDPAGGEQEVPSFHDCAVQQLSECEAKDGYGVPASLRIMTDLLQPASR